MKRISLILVITVFGFINVSAVYDGDVSKPHLLSLSFDKGKLSPEFAAGKRGEYVLEIPASEFAAGNLSISAGYSIKGSYDIDEYTYDVTDEDDRKSLNTTQTVRSPLNGGVDTRCESHFLIYPNWSTVDLNTQITINDATHGAIVYLIKIRAVQIDTRRPPRVPKAGEDPRWNDGRSLIPHYNWVKVDGLDTWYYDDNWRGPLVRYWSHGSNMGLAATDQWNGADTIYQPMYLTYPDSTPTVTTQSGSFHPYRYTTMTIPVGMKKDTVKLYRECECNVIPGMNWWTEFWHTIQRSDDYGPPCFYTIDKGKPKYSPDTIYLPNRDQSDSIYVKLPDNSEIVNVEWNCSPNLSVANVIDTTGGSAATFNTLTSVTGEVSASNNGYTVKQPVRTLSTNNKLSNIKPSYTKNWTTVYLQTIPDFNADISEYRVQMPSDTLGISFGLEQQDPDATVKITAMQDDDPDDRYEDYHISVQPVWGQHFNSHAKDMNYTVHVEYLGELHSKDAALSALKVKGEFDELQLQPDFHPDSLVYNIRTYEDRIQLIPFLRHENASILSGDGIHELEASNSVIKIQTRAHNPKHKRTYTINIHKHLDSRTELSEVRIDNNQIAVQSDVFKYEVEVPANREQIKVEAVALSPKAKVSGTGKFNLNYGFQQIPLTVTAQDGSHQTYRFNITRADMERPDPPATALEEVKNAYNIYREGSTLWIDTPASERIVIYSISGTKLYCLEKPAGKTSLVINTRERILIVKCNSGPVMVVI